MTDKDRPAPGAGRIVVRKRGVNRWNERRKQIFLAALTETANVRRSAAKAKMSLTSAYTLKARDPAFARAWREALEIGYSEVEMALLRQTLEGCERIETLQEGESGKLKYVKTVRSFPFAVAVRLLMAHRDEVLAFRQSRDDAEETEQDATERVRAYLDEIDARLRASESRDEASGRPGS